MHGASGLEGQAVGQTSSSPLSSEPGGVPRPGERKVRVPGRAGGRAQVPAGGGQAAAQALGHGHGAVVNRIITFRGTFSADEMHRTWERELRLNYDGGRRRTGPLR